MKKTFEEILADEFNKEENYSITSGDLDDIEVWAKKIMKEIREATIKECVELSKIKYYAGETGYLDKDVILQLDKNSIEIYEI